MRAARAVLATLTALGLAACTSAISGSPGKDDSEPITAKAVLGDFTTFDPCSLADPKVLTEFGDAELGYPNSFEYCKVVLNGDDDDKRVEVMIGQLSSLDDEARETYDDARDLAGGLWLAEIGGADDGYCDQPLGFADDIALGVNVWSITEDPPGNLCDIADAAMKHVISVVRAGKVTQHDYPRDSFATVDPCEIVPDDALADLPSYASAEEEGYPAKHVCTWRVSDDPDDPNVQLTLGIGPPLSDSTAGTEEDIAGRPSVVNEEPDLGGESWCQIDSDHIPYEAEWEPEAVERVSIDAYGPPDAIDQTCAAARAVAQAAWPELPEP